jgi:3-isopropylmalate/(R)-2-methylmalate dehydratase small subunit
MKMDKFTVLKGRAAPLPLTNVDTDMIIPKQFLKTIKRTGLGIHLFDEMRYGENGKELADFILNKDAYRHSSILVAGENFGCGSSREHAPWSLLDFGIRCVIAPSFADIFHENCFKNGILPIKVPKDQVDTLMAFADKQSNELLVDLMQQEVRAGNHVFSFDVDQFRKDCLLNGLDDIGLTLKQSSHIDQFEERLKAEKPWLLGAI